ncbi:persephin-like [Carassius carassius]|uniref:persephin-like n=1 Tax=Carassius carassius TaxID=217509 RepID=UPI00286884E6|nr:persephin-like [Carassius carassius]
MAIKETGTLAHLSITCAPILKKKNQAKKRRTMRSLLKIIVLLFCVQAGEGHWLRTLLDKDLRGEERRGGDGEEKEGSGRQLERVIRLPRSVESPCALHSILLQVRDLGLGYDSDETVLFKYCSGTCPRLASNHDLTLTNLLQSGVLQYAGHWHHQPCCRPTHHEDIAFLDNLHRWHKVEKLSAAACVCMG